MRFKKSCKKRKIMIVSPVPSVCVLSTLLHMPFVGCMPPDLEVLPFLLSVCVSSCPYNVAFIFHEWLKYTLMLFDSEVIFHFLLIKMSKRLILWTYMRNNHVITDEQYWGIYQWIEEYVFIISSAKHAY